MKKLDEDLKKRIGVDLDLCWFPECKAVWKTEEGTYCPICDTWKCPACHRCFCDLPAFTQYVLDAELASIGLWRPFSNPPKRKKRGGRVIRGVTRDDFIEFAEKFYPSLVADYEAGRITFDKLLLEVERDSTLKWVFT